MPWKTFTNLDIIKIIQNLFQLYLAQCVISKFKNFLNKDFKFYKKNYLLSSIAPIARYASFWNISVITANAMAGDFRKNKLKEFKYLTNIGPSNYWQETFVRKIFDLFQWKKTIMLFDKDHQEQETNSNCFLTMSAIKSTLLNHKVSVDYKIKEKQDTRKYDDLLIEYVQNKFSVVLLCGSTTFVYDLITAAQRQGFNNGEYVFINFDMYAQMHSQDRLYRPWKESKRNFTNDDILAYESLLTVSLKVDDHERKFSDFQEKLYNYNKSVFNSTHQVRLTLNKYEINI